MLINIPKISQTKFDFLIPIFDWKKNRQYIKKLLIFYLKLLTIRVNLKLTHYQRFMKSYQHSKILTFGLAFTQ